MEGFYKLPSIINSDSFLIEQLFCLEFERNHHPWSIIRDPFLRRPPPKSHQKLIHGRPQTCHRRPSRFSLETPSFSLEPTYFYWRPQVFVKASTFSSETVNVLIETQMKVLGPPNEKLLVSIMKNLGSPMKF